MCVYYMHAYLVMKCKIIYSTNSGYIFKQDRIHIYLKSKIASVFS